MLLRATPQDIPPEPAAPPGPKPRIVRIPGVDFDFQIRRGADGKERLHFPVAFFSDIHWGTEACRAKRLSWTFENITMDKLYLVGDIIDGEHMVTKQRYKIAPWHREGMAHVFRYAEGGTEVIFVPGNHDYKLRKFLTRRVPNRARNSLRSLRNGLSMLWGVKFEEESICTMPDGRRLKVMHGDKFDEKLMGKAKGFWWAFGDKFLNFCIAGDKVIEFFTGRDDISLAAMAKRIVKKSINERLGVRKETLRSIDAPDNDTDGTVYGHSHMPEYTSTPGGKEHINDGSSTEHVQGAVGDRRGKVIIMEPHKDYLRVEGRDGKTCQIPWDKLGLAPYAEEPKHFDDTATLKVDRVQRLIYRIWKPREHERVRHVARLRHVFPKAARSLFSRYAPPDEPHKPADIWDYKIKGYEMGMVIQGFRSAGNLLTYPIKMAIPGSHGEKHRTHIISRREQIKQAVRNPSAIPLPLPSRRDKAHLADAEMRRKSLLPRPIGLA